MELCPPALHRQRGFTLLEIMVVVVILGVLASMVIPNLMGNKDRADRQKAVSDLVTLENALEMYKLDNGRYPTLEQGLNALTTKSDLAPEPRNYREGGYLRRLPRDPWDNDYQLSFSAGHGAISVLSLGPDGLLDTDDDVVSWQLDSRDDAR